MVREGVATIVPAGGPVNRGRRIVDALRGNPPWAAAFHAARCVRTYRTRGGTRTSTLPTSSSERTARCSA